MSRLLRATPQFSVADVERAARFYRDVLGFRIAGFWDGEEATPEPNGSPVFAIVVRDDVQLFFSRAGENINRDRAEGAYDVYFAISGVDEFAEQIRAKGAEILDGPEDRVYGQREVVVRDCNGLILTFGEEIAVSA